MSKKTSKFLFHLTIAIVLTLGLSLSFQSLLAAWQAPTANPPDGNVAGPIFNSGTAANPIINQPLIIDERVTFSDLAIFNSDLVVQDWSIYQSSGVFNIWSDFLGQNCLSINDFGDISMVNNLSVAGNITSGGNPVCVDSGSGCGGGASLWTANGTSIYYNGGKVGIGTNNPSATLQVISNNVAENTEFIIDGYNNDPDSGPNISSRRAKGTSASSPVNVAIGDDLGGAVYSGWYSGAWREGGFMDVLVDGTPKIAGIPTSINFATSDGTSGPTYRLTIDADGKVGIGTTDPQRPLHIKSTNAVLRIDSNQESQGGSQIKLTEVDGTTIVDTWAIGRFSNSTGIDGSLRIYYGAGDNYFADSSQTLMFIIKKNGNIGIGTDNPGADKLDVRGRAYASGGWQTTNADYAEWFEKEGRVNPGDIIGINLKTGRARKYQVGDRFIGVYSTNPAVIGNRTMETDQELQKDHVLVGLLGQLEFNKEQVVVENGIVKTKDNKEIGTLLSNDKVLIGVGK